MPLALEDLRVIDIGNEWTAYCTKLLADMGAQVIKVEGPSGDPIRNWPPFSTSKTGERISLQHAYYNANKQSVTLDRSTRTGREVFPSLLRWADVVVASPLPAEIPAKGEGFAEELLAVKPELVVCCITGFGLTGPYRGLQSSSAIAQAMSGKLSVVGPKAGPPALFPINAFTNLTGTAAAFAIVAAWLAVDAVGGQVIDLSAQDVLATHDQFLQRYAGHEVIVAREDNPTVPSGIWDCWTGRVEFRVATNGQWISFRKFLGDPEELSDPQLEASVFRSKNAEPLRPLISRFLQKRDAVEIAREAQEQHIPCSVVNVPGELLRDPHAVDQQVFVPFEDKELGTYEVIRSPYRSNPAISEYRSGAPRLGEHNEDVYVKLLGSTPADLEAWRKAGAI